MSIRPNYIIKPVFSAFLYLSITIATLFVPTYCYITHFFFLLSKIFKNKNYFLKNKHTFANTKRWSHPQQLSHCFPRNLKEIQKLKESSSSFSQTTSKLNSTAKKFKVSISTLSNLSLRFLTIPKLSANLFSNSSRTRSRRSLTSLLIGVSVSSVSKRLQIFLSTKLSMSLSSTKSTLNGFKSWRLLTKIT